MKKRIMLLRYVTQVSKCVVGLFKKKSCGASLCKSEIVLNFTSNFDEIKEEAMKLPVNDMQVFFEKNLTVRLLPF